MPQPLAPIDPAIIPPHIHQEIMRRLHAVEQEHDVRIVLAVESGSRAWGFASPDSDFDVRFIYVPRTGWYLAVDLEEKRDVIDYPIVDEIDLNGWDVRKALRLLRKSNPALVEWLQSPLVYIEQGSFAASARALLPDSYTLISGFHHYRSMAKTTFLEHLQSEQVSLKKYFYVLRPLLSMRWLERYHSPAPIELDKLLHLISDQAPLCAAIDRLRAQKRATPELGRAAPVPELHAFIEAELAGREPAHLPLPASHQIVPRLNGLFHAVLSETSASK